MRETGDEMARIHWSCFSPDRFVFRGTTTTRSEFLPKTGKMGGYVVARRVSDWNGAESDSDTRSFIFTGPDGVQYRWAMGAMGMKYPKASLSSTPPASSESMLNVEPWYEVGHRR